jgi:hypothetical protein
MLAHIFQKQKTAYVDELKDFISTLNKIVFAEPTAR